MDRRKFLGLIGGATAGLGLLGLRRSQAAPFGAFPTDGASTHLPANVRAKKVLEIFLYGGVSTWETLYFVRNYGTAGSAHPNTQYYAFTSANAQALTKCGAIDFTTVRAIGTDANGATVELGPFADRLWQRQDLVARMRLVVQRHNLEPHEAAVPQALTGRPVGQPNAAGLGAHVQRARLDSNDTPNRASPHAYVFATGGISSDNIAAAASAGSHPGSARPLMIKVDHAQELDTLLARGTVGAGRANHDALVGAYTDQYQSRLTWPGQGRVRSARTDDAMVAYQTTTKVDAIAAVIPPIIQMSGSACGTSHSDIPRTAMTAAAHLLTHPTEPASYVCVSDVGLREASGGGGYDTHSANAADTAMNFDNILQALTAIINAPGETDPAKLSLDDTLIILNTEFGRTPTPQQDSASGRNHHPYGYATAFIGGPTVAGVSGAIGEDGMATSSANPAENRIGALLALGIWPFSQEAFAVSDVPTASTELEAAQRAMMKTIGRIS